MKRITSNLLRFVSVLFAVLMLSGCLPGPDSVFAGSDGGAGFFTGLFHGLIAPFTLIASFLTDAIRMYEVANAGPLYDMGFLFGVAILVSIPFWIRIGRRVRRRR